MNTATSQFDGHTPGPWSAVGPHIRAVRHNQPIRVGSTHPAGAGCAISGDTCDGAEEANARLIAAAPALLRQRDELAAALKLLLNRLHESGRPGHDPQQLGISSVDLDLAAARAALASIENGA